MEKLMQYAWQHRLLKSGKMTSTDGLDVEIIDPGWINTDAGPDFFNAKIRIGDRLWAGNVEIHVKASDWYRHRHNLDPAYDSVILHVVAEDDMQAKTSTGRVLRQMVMKCRPEIVELYKRLLSEGKLDLICAGYISGMPSLHLIGWIDSLAFGRIQDKADRIDTYMAMTCNDIEQSLFATLSRALGFGHNSTELERLALTTPLSILRKHADSQLSLEAILLGRAGLIPDDIHGQYVDSLREEYRFMARKFSLTPVAGLTWKMSRMRPQNSPCRRIAMLAAFVSDGFRLMSRILDCRSADDCRRLFDISLKGFWNTSFSFNAKPVDAARTLLSKSSVNSLVINVVVPTLYHYGSMTGDEAMCDRAFDMLRNLPPERNSVVSLFSDAGIRCDDAFTSQALIQLRRNYCERRKCLFCRIGCRMISSH